MGRGPPRASGTDRLGPYTTVVRSSGQEKADRGRAGRRSAVMGGWRWRAGQFRRSMTARPDPSRRHLLWLAWRAAGGATGPVYFGGLGKFRAQAERADVDVRAADSIADTDGRHRRLETSHRHAATPNTPTQG